VSIADRLTSLVPRAIERARGSGRSVLVSAVERIDDVHEVDALAIATSHAARAHDRMYWTRPVEKYALAGIGTALDFTPSGASRFATIDDAWRTLLDDAIVDGVSAERPGATGPTLMGGFAFDADGPRTERWRDFAAASFALPRLQVTTRDDGSWLTANLLVAPDGTVDATPDAIDALWNALRTSAGDASDAPASGDAPVYADARTPDEWRALVQRAVDAIRAGAMEKVVLAREVRGSVSDDLDAAETLRYLVEVHPTCFVFACWRGDALFLGATPELLVQLHDTEVNASALAGSVRRGIGGNADETFTRDLMSSAKDRAEHEVVRRRLCATLGELCTHMVWPKEPHILTLANVHHLYTPVTATIRDGATLLQLVERLHPTPAVGGEPRDAALRFIREHEELDRGWYAAPVGWLQRDRGQFAVALRSALVTDGEASLFAGCGIVEGSDPEREYVESMVKLRPMKMALAASLDPGAHDGEASDASDDTSRRADAVLFVERAS